MATYEHAALMQHKDQNGDMHLLYPITKAENVDGLYGDAALTGVPTAPTAATGTNTTQVATTAFVQQELEDVKKSVSDGKTAVANAITAKGVTTATDATFATMASNISAIESGSRIGLNVFTQETEPETKEGIWIQTANPYQSVIIGETRYSSEEVSGDVSWNKLIDFPTEFNFGEILVYNDEIHVLTRAKGHYKYNGNSWIKVATLPASSSGTVPAVVFNDKIHLFLGGKHYEFDGSSWIENGTAPNYDAGGGAFVYRNKIYMYYGKSIYNFSDKISDSIDLPYNLSYGRVVVYNDEIHMFGGTTSSFYKHFKYDGNTVTDVSMLPYDFYYGVPIVYENNIHILGGVYAKSKNHYKFDGTAWTPVTTLPYSFMKGRAFVYNDELHILGSSASDYERAHYSICLSPPKRNGQTIAIYQNPSNEVGLYAANFLTGVSISGENNKFPSGFDDVYYIDDSGNVEESPTYYGDGTQWIKFKN